MKTLLATLLLFAACLGTADAASLLDVQVVDRSSGQVLETWHHHGRLYVAGTPGNRYAVSLRNKAGGRVLAVLSVDGVNAILGETAAPAQSGYVLTPGQAAEIAGWRKSMDEVAAFYFTSVANSYAGRTDRPQNVGVIGVAVFREAEPVRLAPTPQLYDKADAEAGGASDTARAASKTAQAPAAEARLGTGHGERVASRTEYTDFRRLSDQPAEIVTIYYDSRANLIARGIIPGGPSYSRPNPFPGAFVPDPRS